MKRLSPSDVRALSRRPVDDDALLDAARIVNDVASEGDVALRRLAERYDGLAPGAPLVIKQSELEASRRALDAETHALLERTAARIRRFAEAQRAALANVDIAIEGGRAGHHIIPVDIAGCYAPAGGAHPLVSTLLMTAVTARAAGVRRVCVASPQPGPIMRAAAAIAGADALLAAGGAQAIAALAFGTASVPRVDVIAGPGNKWVTAAKQLLAGRVGIDLLAGPSELVVLADETADAELVVADLAAQAEHALDALPILVTTHAPLLEALVDRIDQGFAVGCRDLDEAIDACDRLAPEHLELHVRDPDAVARRVRHCGALFIGPAAGEVLGDYGAGPNHVLPTGGSARFSGGLSVQSFLRTRTWMRLDGSNPTRLCQDAAALARLEGLEAHARAADRRLVASRR